MERKFLEHSLPRNESSRGAKVPRSECSTERKFHGSESSLCGLPATKVQRNEKTWNHGDHRLKMEREGNLPTLV